MPPPERRLHVLPGGEQPDAEPHRIDNIPAFLDQLHALRIGLPVTYKPREGAQITLGHFVPVNDTTDLVIMSDGFMQLRQTALDHRDMFPLARIANGAQREGSPEDARDYFLSFRRNAISETVIDNEDPEHNTRFATALTHVHGLIERRRLAMDETRELLDTAAPGDVAALAERSEGLNAEVAETIDLLAKEKLGKALISDNAGDTTEVIGYAIPAPVEDAGPNRYLMLFRTGNIYGVEISEGTETAKRFADRNSREVRGFSHLDPDNYTVITSNTTTGDPDLYTSHVDAANNWLTDMREERKRHLATEKSTRRLLTKVHEDITEPTIEDRAREILGQDFLGVEEVKNVEMYLKNNGVNISFDLSDLPPIPYSENDLLLAKEFGEMLVLRPAGVLGNMGVVEPITLQGLAAYFKNGPKKIFHDATYAVEYAFAHKVDDIKFGWALVGKAPLRETLGYPDYLQEQDLLDYGIRLRKRGADKTNITRRTAAEVAWDLALYECNNDEKLLQKNYDATSSVQGKNIVIVGGNARDDGMHTSGIAANKAFANVGVCTVR